MVEELEEEDYTCIFCHAKQAPDEPYKGFNESEFRTQFLNIDLLAGDHDIGNIKSDCPYTLLLTIYLDDERLIPNLGFNIALDLVNFLPGQIASASIPFNFQWDSSDVESFQSKMNSLVTALENGPLERITNISVILFTLTHPKKGYLHSQRDNRGSSSFTELTDAIFPPKLKEQFRKKASRTNLILHASGVFWQQQSLQHEVIKFLNDVKIDFILGFEALLFNWALATPALTTILRKFYIEGMSISTIAEIVGGTGTHGDHSGIVLAQRNRIYALMWHDATLRPFGVKLDRQCKACGVLDAWGKERVSYQLRPGTKEVGAIILECRKCGAQLKKEKPPGVSRLRGGEALTDYRVDGLGDTMIQDLYQVNRRAEDVIQNDRI
ncbi:hypothetical protein BDP27DRAFT_507093 [Rhodocollybia butyracea]|uniref:Uncharacterized protein n=1 Tax=Rhodocollybia butyracea TaxID=206335 RepID=A0A9P5TY19_9AGAR|nr:hypothetical protein BDP27DRAFT_507093 [Rhodocollybia butyracea]